MLRFFTGFAAALLGLTQQAPKAVLASSTISQVGLMVALLGAALQRSGDMRAVAYYAAHRALAKGALFLSVGLVATAAGRWRAGLLVFAGFVALPVAGCAASRAADWRKRWQRTACGLADMAPTVSAATTTLVLACFLVRLARSESGGGGAPALALLAPTVDAGSAQAGEGRAEAPVVRTEWLHRRHAAFTTAYSFWLKRLALVDVLALASLCTIRVIAGAVVIGVAISSWLLAFLMAIFLSLALIKRYVELTARLDAQLPDSQSRGNRNGDADFILALAAASGFNAVTVFMLYAATDMVSALYRYPQVIWIAAPVFAYWTRADADARASQDDG